MVETRMEVLHASAMKGERGRKMKEVIVVMGYGA